MTEAGKAWLEERGLERRLERTIGESWRLWGYREVSTPAWLPWEELGRGASDLPERAYKFLDQDGRVLALRPDITVAIARLVSGDLAGRPRPLRLYYLGNIYRRRRSAVWGEAAGVMEIPQAGLELIGGGSETADAEVLAVAAETLRGLGLNDFRIAVGHVGVLAETLAGAGLGPELRPEVVAALQRRDYVQLERALGRASRPGAAADLLRLLTAPVPADKPGRLTATGSPLGESLGRVLGLIEAYGLASFVSVELGLVRDLEYYTGLVFEVSLPGMAQPLGGGGRYDGLLARFGRAEPATGFAFRMKEVAAALRERGLADGAAEAVPECLLVAEPGYEAEAWRQARELRAAGHAAELDVAGGGAENACGYARRQGIPRVLQVGAAGVREVRP